MFNDLYNKKKYKVNSPGFRTSPVYYYMYLLKESSKKNVSLTTEHLFQQLCKVEWVPFSSQKYKGVLMFNLEKDRC